VLRAASVALQGLALTAWIALRGPAVSMAQGPSTPARDTGATRAAAGARADTAGPRIAPPNARIHLTWHAPYGQPRASDRLFAVCGDTAAKDTLFMCFDPGRGSARFIGLRAVVQFRAAAGESLGADWQFGEGQKLRGLEVELNPDDVPGTGRAWPASAVTAAYYRTTSASGKLFMVVAVPSMRAPAVEPGTLYCFARVLVPRPARKSPGCDRPVCIEWALAALSYDLGDEREVKLGNRFVSWNSRDGKVCAPLQQSIKPWNPQGRSRSPGANPKR